MSEIELSLSLPLDSEGFLRRECPTCECEFKWLAAGEEDDATPAPEGGYFCPYCAVQAPPDAWWTKPQLDAAQATAYDQVLRPEMDKLERTMQGASGGFLQISVSRTDPEPPPALTEVDDMRRVDFACHPSEPVKALDDWQHPVHCLICGKPAD